MLIFDIKENERIKAKYIPSYMKQSLNIHKRKLPKLNEIQGIYDVQIFMMICINYRSVNVGREQKASANKNVLVCIY